MQNHHIKSGFSLIELLVYIAIFSIVSGFIWQGIRWIEEKNDHLARKQAMIRQGLQVFDDVSQMISDLNPTEIELVAGDNKCLKIGVNSLKFKEGTNENANFYALFKYGTNPNCDETSTPSPPPPNKISDYVFKPDSGSNPAEPFFEINSLPANLSPPENLNEKIVAFKNLKFADKTSEYSTVTFKFRSKWIFIP